MLDCIFRFTYRFRLPDNACLPAELETSTEILFKKMGTPEIRILLFFPDHQQTNNALELAAPGKRSHKGK